MLDVRTLYLVLAAVATLIGALILLVDRLSFRDRGLLYWSAANLLVGAGVIAQAARDVIPDWLSIGVSNPLIVLGQGLFWVTMERFFDRPGRGRLPFLLAVAGGLLFVSAYGLGADLEARSILLSLICMVLTFGTAFCLLRHAAGSVRWHAFLVGGLFLGHAGFYGLRAWLVWQGGLEAFFANTLLQAATGLLGILVLISAGAGYLLMMIARQHDQMHQLATMDSLTGLMNRRHFDEVSAAYFVSRPGTAAVRHVLLVADLDHFKQINDRFGHPAGDAVLQAFVRRARNHLRPGDLFARYGGEEFVLLLAGVTAAQAGRIAERIRQALSEEPVVVSGHPPVTATVSIGGVEVDPQRGDFTLFYAMADRALYDAKQAGRNLVKIIHPEDQSTTGG